MLRITKSFVIATALALLALPALANQPEDAWITTKVKMNLLTADGIADPTDINVDTVDGVVTLHGPVFTADEKRQSQARASEVKGVREVRNLLAVVSEPARKGVEASDDELRGRVETVLDRDKALDSSEVKVKSVTNGTVLLSGKADTLTSHRRALEDARAVDGVRKVASEISSPDELGDKEIWSDEPAQDSASNGASDAWITAKSKVRLMAEPGLSPFSINVDTRGGFVTLFGIVGSAQSKQAAEREVKKIAGVKGVENELQVVADVAADKVEAQDDRVLDAVQKRLKEREALADANIDVEVKKGVVRLTGTVASQGDRITALTVARSTNGVASIIDDLQLERKG